MAKAKGKNTGSAAKSRPAKTAARAVDGTGNGPGAVDRPSPISAKDAAARAVAKPAVAPGGDTVGRIKPVAGSDGGEKKASTGPRTRPAPTKRTTPPASGRYTPPVPKSEKISPIWVPILMFACLGIGMLTIILNYVNVLPGPDPSNVYLMIGLGLITVGFITATKYH